MTTWTQLYLKNHLVQRTFYSAPGVTSITAPARSAFIRASMVGAGGWANFPTLAGGAAFARVKAAISAGDAFSVQVGDVSHTSTSGFEGDALGDSKLTKTAGAVVLAKANRCQLSNGKGLAANSIGDVKRDGAAGSAIPNQCGASAGDDADAFPLGFGGPGVDLSSAATKYFARPGAGGVLGVVVYQSGGFSDAFNFSPGNGLVCIEFFDQDPGY